MNRASKSADRADGRPNACGNPVSAATPPLDRLRSKWHDYWDSPQPKKDATFFAVFLAIAFVINGTVAGNVYVPTGSMRNTIREGERFVVWKLGYGVQNPLSPRHKLTVGGRELLRWNDVDRGDIVMFVPPEATGVSDKYVKRVVALSGETVEVRPGVGVFVDGRRLKEPYIRELPQYWIPPHVVPEGKVFVLGDNRNNSFDSHAWGFLDAESVQGVMLFRYWPLWRIGFLGDDSQWKNVMACLVLGFVVAGYWCWQRAQRNRHDSPDGADGESDTAAGEKNSAAAS